MNLYIKTGVFLLITLTASCGSQADQGGSVENCQPCAFNIDPSTKPHLFSFKLSEPTKDYLVIKEIDVISNAPEKIQQTLKIDDMTPQMKGQPFYFEAIDINFDGFNDLLLIVAQGTVNSYAKYWLYNSTSKNFDYLNEFPLLMVDPKTKSLSAYERGGHGGMIYEKKSFVFMNKKLQLIKSEKQDWNEEKGIYINSIQQLKNGQLTTIRKKEVQAPR